MASCKAGPRIRARQKIIRKYQPAERPKPCRIESKIAITRQGEYITISATETPLRYVNVILDARKCNSKFDEGGFKSMDVRRR